jgi:uncharacterized protein YgbK (DUF1537 family)
MSSTKSGLNANFFNKSQLIREVSGAMPGMTNKQVKQIIQERFGIEVKSNLLIAVRGKERTHKLLAPVREKLIRLGSGSICVARTEATAPNCFIDSNEEHRRESVGGC